MYKKEDYIRLKKRFLEQYPEETQETMKYTIFGKAVTTLEERFGKDLCLFNIEELKILLGEFNAGSVPALTCRLSVINKYLDFANSEGFIPSGINYATNIDYSELEQYINKFRVENKYISKEELNEILYGVCRNDQDAAFIALLWEGVKGERMAELINLKVDDVDFENNILSLTDKDGSKRQIKVSNETLKFIKGAIKEEEYEVYYNTVNYAATKRNLITTDYVFRKSSNRNNTEKIGYQTLHDRFKEIKTIYGNPFLTITSIWESGMYNMAYKIKKEKGKLEKEDYIKIFKKYNLNLDDAMIKSKWKNKIKKQLEIVEQQ